MLDIISMIILIIFMILFGISIIIIFVCSNIDKTEEEQRIEDEEQLKFIREYDQKKEKRKK